MLLSLFISSLLKSLVTELFSTGLTTLSNDPYSVSTGLVVRVGKSEIAGVCEKASLAQKQAIRTALGIETPHRNITRLALQSINN